jgi:hypothetical protein
LGKENLKCRYKIVVPGKNVIYTNSAKEVGSLVRRGGRYSIVRVYENGHKVPFVEINRRWNRLTKIDMGKGLEVIELSETDEEYTI